MKTPEVRTKSDVEEIRKLAIAAYGDLLSSVDPGGVAWVFNSKARGSGLHYVFPEEIPS